MTGSDPTKLSSAEEMGERKQISVSRVINASPERIFEIVADPTMHHVIDGSGTVKTAKGESRRLALGDRFGMNMKLFIPYRMNNKVVEFEENKRIAWSHVGGWRWRYELEPIAASEPQGSPASDTMDTASSATATRVTETFDWSTSKVAPYVTLVGWPKRNEVGMERTLARLATFVANTGEGL